LHRLRAYKNRARTGSARKRGIGRVKTRRSAYFALLVCTKRASVTNVVHDRQKGLRYVKAVGLVGAGPARERVAYSHPAGSQRPWFPGVRCSVSETRCNGGAFRDRSSHPWPLLVWPSLALTGQRNRHGSEHRPDLSTKWGLWRRISQGAPGSGGPVQDRVWPGMAKRRAYRDVLAACPGRAHPIPVRAFWREKPLGSCGATFAGWLTPPFRLQGKLPQNSGFVATVGRLLQKGGSGYEAASAGPDAQ